MKKRLFPDDKHDGHHLLSPSTRPRSSLSPTPRSARSHTPTAVRFSDQADSYNYSLSFEESSHRCKSDPDLADSFTVPSEARLSYSDTFVSEVTSASSVNTNNTSSSPSGLSRRSLSDTSLYGNLKSASSLYQSDNWQSLAETVPHSSSESTTKLSSYGTSRESQDTVIESQRWQQGDDTHTTSPHTRYDYTETFETSDLSLSGEESSSTNVLQEKIQVQEDNARLDFIQSLVRQLKLKDSGEVALSGSSPASSPAKQGAKVEVNATVSKYCRQKIKLIKTKKKSGLDSKETREDPAVKETVSVTEYGFHPSIIDKLKTKSFMAAMEQASKEKIHNPRHCKDCRKHWTTLEEREHEKLFVREKTVELQRKTIEDKISRHLANMDSITLIGDIMRSLPKPSDDPEEINRLLNKPLEEHNQLTTQLIRAQSLTNSCDGRQ